MGMPLFAGQFPKTSEVPDEDWFHRIKTSASLSFRTARATGSLIAVFSTTLP